MSIWNTANAARVGLAYLAGFGLVILSAWPAAAEYGPRTRIGNNYQQTSRTLSPSGATQGECNSNTNCYVLFQRAPQQRPLIVEQVSCFVALDPGALRSGILFSVKGQDVLLKQTVLPPVPTTNSNFWLINSPVKHLFKSGERPFILLTNNVSANWTNVFCNISGQLLLP